MRLLAVLTAVAVLPLTAALPAAADNPIPPSAAAGTASEVTQTGAKLSAKVDPNGSATTVVFEYGTSDSYGLVTAQQDAGSGDDPVTVSATVTGLTSDTTYHFRAVATNPAGAGRGADATLRTLAPPRAPSVTTGSARSVTATGATLSAALNPRGQATTYRFEYGTSTKYGSRTPVTSAEGTSSRTVTAPVTGLKPYTTYHYRLVATNPTGTTRGRDRTLRTLRAPTGVTLAASPNPVLWGGSVTLTGKVEGTGVGGTSVAVERTDFPFTRPTWVPRTFSARSDGTFSVTIGPLWQLTRLKLVTRTTNAAASPVVEVGTRVKVGIRKANAAGRRIRLSGTVKPAADGARVSVQRRTASGRWVRIGRTLAADAGNARSRWSVTVTRRRSAATVRTVVVPDAATTGQLRGVSRIVRLAGR